MKITKRQLKRIIKEEKAKILKEKRLLREFNHPDEDAYSIVDMIVGRAVDTGLIDGELAGELQEVVKWALLGGDSGILFRFSMEEEY